MNVGEKTDTYQCYRLCDGRAILVHFDGETDFNSFDDILNKILLYFDIGKHRLVVKLKRPSATAIYMELCNQNTGF